MVLIRRKHSVLSRLILLTVVVLAGCQAGPEPAATSSEGVAGYPQPEPLIRSPDSSQATGIRIERLVNGDHTTLLVRPYWASADAIAKALSRFVSPEGEVEATTALNMLTVRDRNDRIATLEKVLTMLGRQGRSRRSAAERTELIADDKQTTIVYEPLHARSETLADAIKTFVSLDGRVSSNAQLNRLVILERNDRVPALTKVIAALDKTAPQVLVEARVLEITLSDDFEFDIKHTFTQLQGANFLQSSEIELKAPGPSPTVDQGLSLTLRPIATSTERLDTALRLLYKEGRAKILSAPSQIVEVGHDANLITGEEVPIFASTVTGGSTTVSTEFKPVGVKLQVTPLRVSGDTIELEVKPEVSAVTGSSQGPEGSTAPIVASRSTRTTLRLKDGQILSIAGLMRSDAFKDVNKVPLLGDLPLVGFLFHSVRDRNTRTQLMFLLRVHILDDGAPWTIRTHEAGKGLGSLDEAFEKRVEELKRLDDEHKKARDARSGKGGP